MKKSDGRGTLTFVLDTHIPCSVVDDSCSDHAGKLRERQANTHIHIFHAGAGPAMLVTCARNNAYILIWRRRLKYTYTLSDVVLGSIYPPENQQQISVIFGVLNKY